MFKNSSDFIRSNKYVVYLRLQEKDRNKLCNILLLFSPSDHVTCMTPSCSTSYVLFVKTGVIYGSEKGKEKNQKIQVKMNTS
jgi:hypothetical protein